MFPFSQIIFFSPTSIFIFFFFFIFYACIYSFFRFLSSFSQFFFFLLYSFNHWICIRSFLFPFSKNLSYFCDVIFRFSLFCFMTLLFFSFHFSFFGSFFLSFAFIFIDFIHWSIISCHIVFDVYFFFLLIKTSFFLFFYFFIFYC